MPRRLSGLADSRASASRHQRHLRSHALALHPSSLDHLDTTLDDIASQPRDPNVFVFESPQIVDIYEYFTEMPSDHPQTPESPSQISFGIIDAHRKSTSPHFTNSLPTPAHSINGSMSSLGSDVGFHDESSNKRKRDLEDGGDREQKKVHVEDSRLSIEDLHLDVGEKYLLCNTPHHSSSVPYTQDLFNLYSLHDIAQSVARQNPDGSKNPLRKTYKKYIKTLNLSGAFDVDKKEGEGPNTLRGMMMQPDEEWDAQNVRGQEIGRGLSDSVTVSMGAAFKMSRGKIPKSMWDESVLGEIASRALPAEPAKAMHNGVKTHMPQNPAVARTVKGEIPRPKRNVKKRSYGDSSFEGYGEGFVDDDTHETGYSTGEGDDRAGRKRPKKAAPAHNFQGPMRQNSYGPGMVGNKAVLEAVLDYVQGGGVVIVGLYFTCFIERDIFDTFFGEGFGLPWVHGDYHGTTFQFNPSCKLPSSSSREFFPASYSMKVLHVKNARLEQKIFVPIPGGETQSNVFPPTFVDETQAAVAGADIGKGHLFYIGDPPLLQDSHEDSPAIERKPLVLVIRRMPSEQFDERWESLFEQLRCAATVEIVIGPLVSQQRIQVEKPRAIILADSMAASDTQIGAFVELREVILTYVQNGGIAVAALDFPTKVSGDQFDRFFARFGLPWSDAGTHGRTSLTYNVTFESFDVQQGRIRFPSLHQFIIPPSDFHLIGGVLTHQKIFVPGYDPFTTSVSDVNMMPAAVAAAQVGSGFLAYMGTMEYESCSLYTQNALSRLLLSLCGLVRPTSIFSM
ncbi:hypothetical protein G7Y89_g14096 [Cudoniella acicularis]|uniref:Mediator of RNA polymerase II transcription subunit 19 n=1 Tax=Cudoniella acicularis TaxID=354080 RepID=A0A8H4R820_9HELO|nr:hypothetical protein G7Y89_g14096 [Cudoniella acicularis]